MLLTKIKKIQVWFLPLFLIIFAVYYAVFSKFKIKEIDHSVSIIVCAKIEKDDTLQLSFSTPDFGFSKNNSKKINITGSHNFQNIVCTLPDFIQVKKIKLIFNSNVNTLPIDIQKISIQKNSMNYTFGKNDINKLFPITKGFLHDSITEEYHYYKEEGIFKPYFQSKDISDLYESVRLSNYKTPRITIIVIVFFITLLTTLAIFFCMDFVKDKLSNYHKKPVIKILKCKIELNRLSILSSVLFLFIIYVLIFGNIRNDSYSIIKTNNTLNANYDTSIYKIYDSIPMKPANNLIYNGNFEYGFRFWTSDVDTSNFSLINTPFGKGLRISIEDVLGQNWFLKYNGRPIIYYPGHKYQIRFKYRIIKGNKNQFKIGWFFKNKPRFFDPTNLKLRIFQLPNNWFEAKAEILFSEGHYNLPFGLHSLDSNAIIVLTDIQLIDLYNDEDLIPFVDQITTKGKLVDQAFNVLSTCCEEQGNLVLNGNFKNRLLHWHAYADSTDLDWIETPFGKGVRVTRTDGDGGYWSLYYTGPKIEYKANHTYFIEFKYRIIKGSNDPFNTGWWIKDNGIKSTNLPLKTTYLRNGWYSAKTEYTFKNSYSGLAMMFNCFEDHSIVEFSDIWIRVDSTSIVD